MGQKTQDSPLVWQMQPHTPEAFGLLLLIRLLLMLELFSRKAREEAGQLFLRSGERKLGGPQAAEEEASLSWPRGLVPDEEGSLPLPSSG